MRGSLGSINQLVICIGIVAALVVNVVLPATAWRSMFYFATIPGLLLALGAPQLCHPALCACLSSLALSVALSACSRPLLGLDSRMWRHLLSPPYPCVAAAIMNPRGLVVPRIRAIYAYPAGLAFTPESPRWLSAKGRTAEAEAAAEKLWGPSGPGELTEGATGEGPAASRACSACMHAPLPD